MGRFEQLEPRLALAGDLVISEFMASNDSALLDEDGDSSDWLEIHNPTAAAVDLQGWYLTDDTAILTKWQIPDVSIDPGEYLLVWASDKDRSVPSAPLHTNFKLSAAGEPLALVENDGVTVVHAYTPEFPDQHEDVSYGLGMDVASTTLIAEGAMARTHVPLSDAFGVSWTEIEFDDSGWQSGPTGVGYEGNPPGYDALLGSTVPLGTVTAYVRVPFVVSDADAVSSLVLKMKYDDGFAAYLNGVRLNSGSANAPALLDFDSEATADHNDADAVDFIEFDVSAQRDLLVDGANVLAIHALNRFGGSSDMLVVPELVATTAALREPFEEGYFVSPSPGAFNDAALQGFVADTTFSVDRGLYDSPFTLQITTATPGASISVTLDGTIPTLTNGRVTLPADAESSPIAEVLVSGSGDGVATVRAAAFKDGHVATNVDTQTYVFLDDVIANQTEASGTPSGFPADGAVNGKHLDYGLAADIVNDPLWGAQLRGSLEALPTLSMVTDPDHLFDPVSGIYVNAGGIGRAWERPISLELIHPDGSPGFQVEAGARIRGNFSLSSGNPKHAFRLFFRGDYGDSKLNYPLFGSVGVDEFDKIDLRTFQNDSWAWQGSDQLTMIHDVFSRDTQRDMGQPYTRSRYYHLYINGQYWGIYQTQERSEAAFGESYFGGIEASYDTIKAAGGSQGYITEATDGDMNGAWRDLWDLANQIESESDPAANYVLYMRAQGLNPDGSRNPSYPVLLDVDNLIDYMNVIFYTGDEDAPLSRPLANNRSNNWFAVRNREGELGFQFFAHDAEQTMLSKHNVDGLQADRTGPFDTSNKNNFLYSNPQWIHEDLMEGSLEYRMQFADRVFEHYALGGALTEESVTARFDARAAELDAAVIAHSARWGNGSGQNPSFDKNTWRAALEAIRDEYFAASPRTRGQIVLDQLRSDGLYPSLTPPEFNQQGGVVDGGFLLTMTATFAGGIGDFDGDLDIDSDDFAILTDSANWLQSVPPGTRGDINGDGFVDLNDFRLFKDAEQSNAGTIYYTLDGATDPRLVGGTLNPHPAVAPYTGSPISIAVTTTVRARVYDGTYWSALNEATFTVALDSPAIAWGAMATGGGRGRHLLPAAPASLRLLEFTADPSFVNVFAAAGADPRIPPPQLAACRDREILAPRHRRSPWPADHAAPLLSLGSAHLARILSQRR